MIRDVVPEVEHGRFPVKRILGDGLEIEADVFLDGTDALRAVLLHRGDDDASWSETPMDALGNDRWRARFDLTRLGMCRFTIEAWVDAFGTWQRDFRRRVEARQEVSMDLRAGAAILRQLADHAPPADADALRRSADALDAGGPDAVEAALGGDVARLAASCPDRSEAVRYEREVPVLVDRDKARFSAWYEMFPRSTSPVPGRPGTVRDAEARLGYVQELGFDVLYLPPIHPIGRSHRKGRNNALLAAAGDPGSPWAIGAAEGGHTAVHPDLGTLGDFHHFQEAARAHGLEVALDLAFQCSADHPYLREHPAWFRHRPDGTIQYAENPP